MYRLATMMAWLRFVFGFGLVRPLEADDTKDTQERRRQVRLEGGRGGLMEVKLGKLAMEHAANADVRKFGERMVADHGKAIRNCSASPTRRATSFRPTFPRTTGQVRQVEGSPGGGL